MYGIVNKSIQELVTANFGTSKWEEIKQKSNINIDFFISSELYDDNVTFELATTIAKDLNITVNDVLQLFGEWWILHTGKNHYGYLLESGGNNFKAFLENLPSFHNRVMMLYPKITPPEFKVSNVQPNSLHLHYYSKRIGLTAFVLGLMIGLGKFFNTEIEVAVISSNHEKETHDIIEVKWKN